MSEDDQKAVLEILEALESYYCAHWRPSPAYDRWDKERQKAWDQSQVRGFNGGLYEGDLAFWSQECVSLFKRLGKIKDE